ncbi:cytoplasmic protein [Rhizoctonia solani AG-3 Rhs1AP]|uniref:Cytoplasmic protein n=1 Tax=Rhizoctonia solani AG-3 Rhs1AP TaxID=1086054 RepID=X8J6H5_9AGAM|nr:cytoplasmic protein [Rhizoctonia solani AG-3 Rhs1AP]
MVSRWHQSRRLCYTRDNPVCVVQCLSANLTIYRSYLLNTSILAARTFLTTFIGLLLASPQRATLLNQHFPDPVALKSPDSDPDEVQITTDPTLNFLQLAIQTCQRAGWGPEARTPEEEKHNRVSREAWLRLASRYRARIVGGEIMRDVCLLFCSLCAADQGG